MTPPTGQNKRLLEHWNAAPLHWVDQPTAAKELHVGRLASRINELRQAGLDLETRDRPTADGGRLRAYRPRDPRQVDTLLRGENLGTDPAPTPTLDPSPRATEPRQADLFASETAVDGPSWLSRARWEL